MLFHVFRRLFAAPCGKTHLFNPILKWLFYFACLFFGSRDSVVKYKWLSAVDSLSCMLMRNASETTLRNVKRFHNPGSTLRLMVATVWEASSPLVLQSAWKKADTQRCGCVESSHLHFWWFGGFRVFIIRLKPKLFILMSWHFEDRRL